MNMPLFGRNRPVPARVDPVEQKGAELLLAAFEKSTAELKRAAARQKAPLPIRAVVRACGCLSQTVTHLDNAIDRMRTEIAEARVRIGNLQTEIGEEENFIAEREAAIAEHELVASEFTALDMRLTNRTDPPAPELEALAGEAETADAEPAEQ